MKRRKLQKTPQGWQHRPRGFSLQEPEPESDLDDGALVRAKARKRPVRCRFCPNRFAYPWTRDAHLRKVHAALLPASHRPVSEGPVACRWCPNGYQSQQEVDLHEQALHARNLALDMGGYSTAGA